MEEVKTTTNQTQKPRLKNDSLWKGIIEKVFDDFLRFVFPKADRLFDIGRGFEFLEQELREVFPEPDKKAETKFVDKLVKVFLRDGREEWILCHCEVQGKNDKEFAERMYRYHARIFARFDRPVTAIAIFTGRDGHKLPGMYHRKVAGTELKYKYNTIRVLDYSDRSLVMNRNPFALVMLAAKKALLKGKNLDELLLKEKEWIVTLLLKRGYIKEKANEILAFLNNYVRFENPETNVTFAKRVDQLTRKVNTMSVIEMVKQMKIDEARERASEEATNKKSRTVVINLLTNTSFTVKKIAALADVSETFVKQMKTTLKQAPATR